MLSDYCIGPVMFPIVAFDERFAKKYGINEAIIFNELAYLIGFTEETAKHRSYWDDKSGYKEENDKFWVRLTEEYLYHSISGLFNTAQIKKALSTLESKSIIFVRASVTSGYYWVALGEENDD